MTVTSPAGAVSPGPEAAARHEDMLARRKTVLGSQETAPGHHHAVLAMKAALATREAGR